MLKLEKMIAAICVLICTVHMANSTCTTTPAPTITTTITTSAPTTSTTTPASTTTTTKTTTAKTTANTEPIIGPTPVVVPTTKSQTVPPPPPPVTTTAAPMAQWIAVGGLNITNPIVVRAVLTAPCARTAAQNAIITNITNIIKAQLAAIHVTLTKIIWPAPKYGLSCLSGKRDVRQAEEVKELSIIYCDAYEITYSTDVYATPNAAVRALDEVFPYCVGIPFVDLKQDTSSTNARVS